MREGEREREKAYDSSRRESGRSDGKDSPVLAFDSALWSMTNEFESVLPTKTLQPGPDRT